MLERGLALSIVTWPEHALTERRTLTDTCTSHTSSLTVSLRNFLFLQRESVFSSVLGLRLSISATVANTSDLKASYLFAGLALDALFLSGLWHLAVVMEPYSVVFMIYNHCVVSSELI